MNGPIVKICGVRSPEIARVVSESGADLMGLIFAPSRRQVSEEQAREIVEELEQPSPVILNHSEGSLLRCPQQKTSETNRRSFASAQDDRARAIVGGHHPQVVGVFVNERVDEMNRLAETVGLDVIQLSGDEPAAIQRDLVRPVIRALRLPLGITPIEARNMAEDYLDCGAPAWALLLDTYVDGSYGGNGISGDWNVARCLAERYPVLLAGGLTIATINEALQTVRPFGVDVSSGVESEGVKDAAKIQAFMAAVRSARPFASHPNQ